ncbi:MAG: anti-sigma regulatory factor [Plectolyngbya sp. WJT66-NPBG17]|jgi:serine/threonine-protein kinase RsbW|nr:anti-sigma regulatory factor [Plectolyngbya sp. WJT66-NPBG17]MBW4526421.1 anti-sigma regulatory factor [Phormidium tanganyikae FI6-MK23]
MSNLAETGGVIYFDRLIVQTDASAIAKILTWFESFQQAPVSQAVWLQGQIGLIEAFTNAVRHAHAQLPRQTPIKLEAGVYVDRLEIKVWDRGVPFDFVQLLDRVEQDYPEPLEHEAHWGAALFKKLRDRHDWNIEYHCSREGQNCLRLIKFY